jgi:hypothetical protein
MEQIRGSMKTGTAAFPGTLERHCLPPRGHTSSPPTGSLGHPSLTLRESTRSRALVRFPRENLALARPRRRSRVAPPPPRVPWTRLARATRARRCATRDSGDSVLCRTSCPAPCGPRVSGNAAVAVAVPSPSAVPSVRARSAVMSAVLSNSPQTATPMTASCPALCGSNYPGHTLQSCSLCSSRLNRC